MQKTGVSISPTCIISYNSFGDLPNFGAASGYKPNPDPCVPQAIHPVIRSCNRSGSFHLTRGNIPPHVVAYPRSQAPALCQRPRCSCFRPAFVLFTPFVSWTPGSGCGRN